MAMHPEAGVKVGCGIDYFTVEIDQEFGTTRHFMIHRIDRTSTDVSFKAPIDGRNHRKVCLEAMRREIAGQIISFRDSMLN
jgi:hypothetical protein